MWPAAAAICAWMRSVPELFEGTAILEVGAGTGACGLYAAALGASHVVLTDGGQDWKRLQHLMTTNHLLNSQLLLDARVEVARLDWGCDPALLPSGPFTWVIGADVTWGSDFDAHHALAASLAALLARDSGDKLGAPVGKECRVALAMQHGLPLPVDGDEANFRDETLEQFRQALAPHGLEIRALARRGPITPEFLKLCFPAEAFSAYATTSEVVIIEVLAQ